MPAGAFAVPIAGATILNVWKPPVGVTPGPLGDATAPFALGTPSLITPPAATNRTVAKFCRVGATGIAAAGTAGIGTDGVTAAAAGGNTWTNDTGVALVTGDYVWLTTGQVVTAADEPEADALAADEAAADAYGKKMVGDEKKAKAHS